MEFALEDYGWVPGKLVRAELKRQLSGDPLSAIKMRRMERFAERMVMFQRPSVSSDARALRDLLRMVLVGTGERVLIEAVESSEIELPPWLLSTLESFASSGSVPDLVLRTATATKSAFDRLRQRGMDLHLTDCSLEQGVDLYMGVYSPTVVADIAAGDAVAAGAMVALRGDPGDEMKLSVLSRIYRKVCQNGMVVFEGERDAQEINMDRLAEEPSLLEDTIHRELAARLDGRLFEVAVDCLRQRDAEPIPADEVLIALLGARMDADRAEAVIQRYRADGRFTRWGLVNAITAEARDLPRGAALELERVGAHVAGVSSLDVARSWARERELLDEVRTTLEVAAKRERIAS